MKSTWLPSGRVLCEDNIFVCEYAVLKFGLSAIVVHSSRAGFFVYIRKCRKPSAGSYPTSRRLYFYAAIPISCVHQILSIQVQRRSYQPIFQHASFRPNLSVLASPNSDTDSVDSRRIIDFDFLVYDRLVSPSGTKLVQFPCELCKAFGNFHSVG